jgi:hypothetical protein
MDEKSGTREVPLFCISALEQVISDFDHVILSGERSSKSKDLFYLTPMRDRSRTAPLSALEAIAA